MIPRASPSIPLLSALQLPRLFAALDVPQGVEQTPAAHPNLQVPALGEPPEHPVRLLHRERGRDLRPRAHPIYVEPEKVVGIVAIAAPLGVLIRSLLHRATPSLI